MHLKNDTSTCINYPDPSRYLQIITTYRPFLRRLFSLVGKLYGLKKSLNMTSRFSSVLERTTAKLTLLPADLEISLKRGMIVLALYKP